MKRNIDDVTAANLEGGEGVDYTNALDSNDPLFPHINDFDEVQKELLELDEQCANEQMEIQRKYDTQKQPYFERRQAIIDKIPGFWYRAISHHPALSYLTSADIAILEHLQKIELYDNLDNNGSYKLSLIFNIEAEEYMTPLILTKHIQFEMNKETVVECTKINWKAGKSPIDVAIKARENEKCIDWSLFEWFTEDEWLNRPDFGEIVRRELWHAPLAYYMNTVAIDYLDDDYSAIEEDDD
ncbi:bifunctional Nucleosome assembly protein (NAP)/NAP-like superfamily/p53-like tetramerization domain superfamily [Babesia duncani]|uniref:Bifunctional Nucleosome assembly protein (NAP)/NAP-like superfamily/p53-like tetramerization domain superfamily n=1 Tax=Babesia duncani TaxID=323732 RepID=A0AAD9PNL2_9APIC|nr:bifunctional Nucleosome assembly protein (NAP)/NAP-like superfamily/p53-like tetramerization domain superfamily [Babesia duncani]